jgi:signal transduction histidine kinase
VRVKTEMDGNNKRGWLSLSKRLVVLNLLLWFGFGLPLRGQDQTIKQMVHKSWTGRDGAPQSINNLAQTTDGMLWLGSREGLYQFDGLQFELFRPVRGDLPRQNVQTLFASRDGDLWIISPTGSPIRIHGGDVKGYGTVDGGSLMSIHRIQQTSDGTIWALLNDKQIIRLGKDDVWHTQAGPKADAEILSVFFIDSSDTQWVVADNFLYRRGVSESRFSDTGVYVFGAAKLEESFDHSIWIAGEAGKTPPKLPGKQLPDVGLKHVDRLGKPLAVPKTMDDVTDVIVSPDGSTWLSHSAAGLERSPRPAIADHNGAYVFPQGDRFDERDGLASPGYRALLRDRDGNIWVGGARGLDQFKRATLVPAIAGAKAGNWSVCAAPSGDVWLGSFDNFLALIRKGHTIPIKIATDVTALSCAKDGSIRMLDNAGIAEVRGNRVERLPLLPDHSNYFQNYQFVSFLELLSHDLIASTRGATESGLWIYRNQKWQPLTALAGITRISAMTLDDRNALILGGYDGTIRVLKPGAFEIASTQMPGIGIVMGFAETSHGLTAFGSAGIAVNRESKFLRLPFADPEVATSVAGLTEDRVGDLWFQGLEGIARIRSNDLTAALADSRNRITVQLVNEGDFTGPHSLTPMAYSVQSDANGNLWFATENGVVSLDPAVLRVPARLPSLAIRSLSADGRPPGAAGTFPPVSESVTVRYFGLNLSDPARVIYRYQLEGFDHRWLDAGTRTEANYPHLRPGKYVFQVVASNGDGVWTGPVASTPFTVLPRLYQTWWFYSLCAIAVILLLWRVVSARINHAASAIRIRAEERADERIRIARDLHDTLLQGVQGLLLTFHVAAEKVPADHESKKSLERALATADRIILEGRNRVSRLRSEHLTDNELKPSIEGLGADLNTNSAIHFAVERRGGNETLDAPVADEIFSIAREALTNAFRHAGASRIVVELDYQRRQFKLNCRDNGRGFNTQVLANGHWGVRGMAERAAKIGAKFSCLSSPGAGTDVEVIVPARRAFARPNGLPFFSRKGRSV